MNSPSCRESGWLAGFDRAVNAWLANLSVSLIDFVGLLDAELSSRESLGKVWRSKKSKRALISRLPLKYVSPQQRHTGQDQAILAARHTLYRQARQRHPARWTGATRDWSLIDVVTLNPERDEVVKLATCVQHTQLKAA